ncbi:uncharacterized protein [Epargyreus clarus]|uniref:uncharacterized protein n=1 Tax=Epargyreus clarus TaxID=520877 RepID=UPI003C2DAC8C
MSHQLYVLAAIFTILSTSVNCKVYANAGSRCIDYYKTGENFDLEKLNGAWHAVYFWPPIQRQRDSCAVVNFKKVSSADVSSTNKTCHFNIPSDEAIWHSTYTNHAGKFTNVFYYGQEEVKNQIRSCNRFSKYLFIDVNDDYLLGINCSMGGRGMLLAKQLPTVSQVQAVVNGIDIMSGRDGRPDCQLRSR